MESKPELQLFVWTRFRHANRYPLRSKPLSFIGETGEMEQRD